MIHGGCMEIWKQCACDFEIEVFGLEGRPTLEPSDFTCYSCFPWLKIGKCNHQFDEYCTDGDCLAEK